MNYLLIALAALLLCAALWTVMAAELVHAAIALALTSVILSVFMFELAAPWAAVFELSVCAGLITVVFISAISMTKRATEAEEKSKAAAHFKRFAWLPLVLIVGAVSLIKGGFFEVLVPPIGLRPDLGAEMRGILWGARRFDLVGQILIILAGVFGVVVLFKSRENSGEK